MEIVSFNFRDSASKRYVEEYSRAIRLGKISPKYAYTLNKAESSGRVFIGMEGDEFLGVLEADFLRTSKYFSSERVLAEILPHRYLFKNGEMLKELPNAEDLKMKIDERGILYITCLESFKPGQGIGSRLLGEVLNENHSSALLYSVEESIKFYKKRGFIDTGYFVRAQSPILVRNN